ncbi:metal ABC transporter permease [Candidatus Cyanaurora vandensis]|uniref:metal ABC transporter permease n=1 Tax=Candidatus Cyanaurora vandensis TaxID=2714958 RepID=UPI00257C7BA8|nr:metal ABC transporter permease [Candidatus Cyanaurora vandensis]
MANLIDLLQYPFMVRALLGAVLLGVVCPLLGTLVILKRMAFFADAVAHFALPGVVLALGLGWSVGGFLTGFCMAAALVILWVKNQTAQAADTVLGVFSATAIALGVVLLSWLPGYQGQVWAFLFGDILAVGWVDLGVLLGLGGLVVAFMIFTLQAQVLINFQPDLARVQGFAVGAIEIVFVLLLAGVVATAIKLVGALLVTAFLVIPAALARNVAKSYIQMLLIAPVVGVVGAVVGIVASAVLNTPSGPMMVLVQAGLFLGSLVVVRK